MSVVPRHQPAGGGPTDYAAEVRGGTAWNRSRGAAELRHWLGAPMTAGEQVLGVHRAARAGRGRSAPPTSGCSSTSPTWPRWRCAAVRLFEEAQRAPYGELAAAQDQLVRTEKLRGAPRRDGLRRRATTSTNLLASVLGRAQLLMRRVQDPQQLQWLRVIERSALDGRADRAPAPGIHAHSAATSPWCRWDVTQMVARTPLDITQVALARGAGEPRRRDRGADRAGGGAADPGRRRRAARGADQPDPQRRRRHAHRRHPGPRHHRRRRPRGDRRVGHRAWASPPARGARRSSTPFFTTKGAAGGRASGCR